MSNGKLDFDFDWRPWRMIYVAAITFFVYILTENLWSLLTLLTLIDLTIENTAPKNDDVVNPLYGPDSHD